MNFCNAIDLAKHTWHSRISHPCVNTLDIMARDRRLFEVRFGESEENLGDFPAAASKKGKNVVAS